MSGHDVLQVSLGRAGLIEAGAGLIRLPPDECWSLLKTHDLGRVSLVIHSWPRIFPVNYAAGEGAIVFRTEPGAKLEHGPGAAACFEVDGYDERTASGWSVMAAGIIEDVTDRQDERARALRQLSVCPAAPGKRSHWLALTVQELTGRSFQGGWMVPGHYLG
jgi:nitroimidazol reductase NimA-like FMN-containing flavoprotein (pyridoxamine 5'-phosphate oxidase superfamily)